MLSTILSKDAVKQYDSLLTNPQAATYLGITPRTLEVWRCTKRHEIPYLKVGRLVKYRKADLDTWLRSRTIDGGNLA
jgi:excisionase family DNA binding protein